MSHSGACSMRVLPLTLECTAKKCHIPVLAPNKKSNSSNSLDLNALSNNISMIVAVVVFAIMMIGAAIVFINSIS